MKAWLAHLIATLSRLRDWLLRQPLFTSTILPRIPRPLRWALRKIYFLPSDVADRLLRQTDALVPPRSENFTGSAEGFRRSGERLVELLTDLGGLTPDAKVVDLGCGVGRLAVALTGYLSAAGSYEGLDIVPPGIAWCTETITPKHPNFRFSLADVYNKEYNPDGHFEASDYRLPYSDGSADVVVLASVFTHMLPPDMEQYVKEIARILKPGGRCFATYFLVNNDSLARMLTGESTLRFRHHVAPAWLVNKKVPELSVGYDEDHVRSLYSTAAGYGDLAIHYGGWCGRPPLWSAESGLGDQDIIVATAQR